ncbi:MAG: hypothetical protein KAR31_06320, partial [Candidatus Omnitrophica bacterium]|nr:hypothetical protein [Candidatus Omnitrophota bacterium]
VGIVATSKNLEPSVIRSQVASVLPKYMVPNKVHITERMPKNTNGKTDRNKLRDLYLLPKQK